MTHDTKNSQHACLKRTHKEKNKAPGVGKAKKEQKGNSEAVRFEHEQQAHTTQRKKKER
jgi:hypothetical protein